MQPIGRMAEKKIEQPAKKTPQGTPYGCAKLGWSSGQPSRLCDIVANNTLWYEVVKAIQRKHYVVIYTRSANKAPRPASL